MTQSAEERAARAAQRMRDLRSRQKRERDAAAAAGRERAANDAHVNAPRTMRDAVEASLAAMKWLAPSDDAAVAQVRSLARMVDVLEYLGDTVRALSAHGRLTTALDRLGGTPTVRMAHELRSLRLTKDEGSDVEGEQPAASSSQFERPPKRLRAV